MPFFILHLVKKKYPCHPGLSYPKEPSKTRQFPFESGGTEVNWDASCMQMLTKPQPVHLILATFKGAGTEHRKLRLQWLIEMAAWCLNPRGIYVAVSIVQPVPHAAEDCQAA